MAQSGFSSPALLLRSFDRGDDDRALTLLTPGQGRLRALARRARGSKRRFGAALQSFCLFDAAFKTQASGIHFLDSAEAREFPLGVAPSWEAMAGGWLCLELADAFSPEGQSQPAFFELILGSLRRLGRGVEPCEQVRLSVLWGVMDLEGWAPDLERCCGCGAEEPGEAWSLDALRGGLLCPRCASPGSARLGPEALPSLSAAAQGRPGPSSPDAEAALIHWAQHHLGRALRSVTMLGGGLLAPRSPENAIK